MSASLQSFRAGMLVHIDAALVQHIAPFIIIYDQPECLPLVRSWMYSDVPTRMAPVKELHCLLDVCEDVEINDHVLS